MHTVQAGADFPLKHVSIEGRIEPDEPILNTVKAPLLFNRRSVSLFFLLASVMHSTPKSCKTFFHEFDSLQNPDGEQRQDKGRAEKTKADE